MLLSHCICFLAIISFCSPPSHSYYSSFRKNCTGTSSRVATLIAAGDRDRVRGLSSEEFRAIPEVKTAPTISIPAETLKEGLKGSMFATATNEGKHILTGVYFKICQYSLEFAATNDDLLVVLNTFGVETDRK
jgi:DNA polymerase-3 subunit beta